MEALPEDVVNVALNLHLLASISQGIPAAHVCTVVNDTLAPNSASLTTRVSEPYWSLYCTNTFCDRCLTRQFEFKGKLILPETLIYNIIKITADTVDTLYTWTGGRLVSKKSLSIVEFQTFRLNFCYYVHHMSRAGLFQILKKKIGQKNRL